MIGVESAVVPTKTVPEGLAAILAFNPEADVAVNAAAMAEAASYVKTGQVTHAVRETIIDGVDIAKDDFMGIAGGKIVTASTSLDEVMKTLMDSLIDEDDEIVTILYGEDISEEDASTIANDIENRFDHVEVELYHGKQPLYPYIISVE